MAGTIVANSTVAGQNLFLTFANGGNGLPIVYTAADAWTGAAGTFGVEDIDNLGNLVTAAGAATRQCAPNLPIGYSRHNYYGEAHAQVVLNQRMQDKVTVLCDQFIEIPVLTGDQQTGNRALVSGCLVVPMPGAAGVSVRYLAADSVEQIIGRVIRVEGVQARGGLDRVFTTRGLNLPGTGTGGIPTHLNHTNVTHSAKINITNA
jgi:hypothetical protein